MAGDGSLLPQRIYQPGRKDNRCVGSVPLRLSQATFRTNQHIGREPILELNSLIRNGGLFGWVVVKQAFKDQRIRTYRFSVSAPCGYSSVSTRGSKSNTGNRDGTS